VPELEEPCVEHLENAADVTRTPTIEVELSGDGVEILRVGAVAFALEKFHRHEGVEEVSDPARMQAKLLTQLDAGEAPVSKDGEKPKLDGGQEDLGIPKAKSGLQNRIGRRRLIHKDREAGRPGIPLASAKFVVRVN
jgi:hypothetical protein